MLPTDDAGFCSVAALLDEVLRGVEPSLAARCDREGLLRVLAEAGAVNVAALHSTLRHCRHELMGKIGDAAPLSVVASLADHVELNSESAARLTRDQMSRVAREAAAEAVELVRPKPVIVSFSRKRCQSQKSRPSSG